MRRKKGGRKISRNLVRNIMMTGDRIFYKNRISDAKSDTTVPAGAVCGSTGENGSITPQRESNLKEKVFCAGTTVPSGKACRIDGSGGNFHHLPVCRQRVSGGPAWQ